VTTREKFAEAAQHLRDCGTDDDGVDELFILAAKLCQQVADGAVLCKWQYGFMDGDYIPLDPQP
jgi:hypothetical protein